MSAHKQRGPERRVGDSNGASGCNCQRKGWDYLTDHAQERSGSDRRAVPTGDEQVGFARPVGLFSRSGQADVAVFLRDAKGNQIGSGAFLPGDARFIAAAINAYSEAVPTGGPPSVEDVSRALRSRPEPAREPARAVGPWQVCPVCQGVGSVPFNFYDQGGSSSTSTVMCRTCRGATVISARAVEGETVDEDAYRAGFIDGATAWAHWRDGKQEVGTTGKTLKEAIEQIKRGDVYNYLPRRVVLPSESKEAGR